MAIFSKEIAALSNSKFITFSSKQLIMKTLTSLFLLAIALVWLGCNQNQASPKLAETLVRRVAEKSAEPAPTIPFDNYWFQGKAEISSYAIDQERYGEQRTGDAVLVFVTEDFSRKKQVKLDDAAAAGTDRVPILKLNLIKKFKTGIYDYSMLQSIFTPIDWKKDPRSLKTTASSQEWCGHTFAQFNLEGKNWRLREFSYFEKEADIDLKLPAALLEDELWTRLRIDPASIPTGEVELIPASFFSRLKHEKQKAIKAKISFEEAGNDRLMKVEYESMSRSLAIRFEKNSPFKIVGWEEKAGGKLACRATLKQRILSDYWSRHDNDDLPLRDSLLLKY